MEDLTGKQLGPYQIVAPLGKGGMASVYKAYQPQMDRYVALKILPRNYADDPEFKARFELEARTIARLQHPHILPVHDFGEADDYTYLVMRFVETGTLTDWLKDHQPLTPEQIRRVITQVGDALDYAHGQGVIHRDVKPSNILIDRRGNCLLTDFGIAKMIEGSLHLTRTGGVVGTPAYMSPEQGLGQSIDNRSDIYSLGVILFEMATGHPPYQAETPMAVMIKHIQDPLPLPSHQNDQIQPALERVIMKALAKGPEDRFETAAEMVAALQTALEPETVVTPAVHNETQLEVPGAVADTPVEAASSSAQMPRPRGWLVPVLGLFAIAAVVALGLVLAGREGEGDGQLDGPEATPSGSETGGDEGQQADDAEEVARQFEVLAGELELAYGRGDTEAIVGLLSALIKLKPDEPGPYCERGFALRDLEAFAESRASFDQCRARFVALNEREPATVAAAEATVTEAMAMQIAGAGPDAVIALYDAALSKPETADWLICMRAEAFLHYEDLPAAIEDFDACQRQTVGDEYWQVRSQAAALAAQGELSSRDGNFLATIEAYRQWAEVEPDQPWPYCSLGHAYNAVEDLNSAAVAFRQCLERAQDDATIREARVSELHAMGKIAEQTEDWDDAIGNFSEAISLQPDLGFLYCERSTVFLTLEAREEAGRDAERCLELAHDDPGLRAWAEEILAELGRG